MQSTTIKTNRHGTAKVEETLTELFPNFPVLRVDRDSTSRVGSWQKFMIKFKKVNPPFYLGLKCWQKDIISLCHLSGNFRY
jgi:primosomal protein N'